MTTVYTSLLGLALPVTGELSGTWGDTVNNGLTSLLDSAVAGTTTLSTDADVTLTTTTGAANQARAAIILWTATGSVTRNIVVPSASKVYAVINNTGGSQSIVVKGAATTGVTITAGNKAVVVWNGSDFVQVGGGGDVTLTGTQTLTNKTLVAPALGTPVSGNASSMTVDGVNGVGYINIPQNSQSAAYTLVLADAGKHIFHPSADTTARVFTIPANGSVAYPVGTAITFVNQNAAGVLTIAITTDTMRLAGPGTTGSRTLAANGIATCLKLTATQWIISGTNLT